MTSRTPPRRLVLGITGATGAIFGVRILERLQSFPVQTHLILSSWGARTLEHETEYKVADLHQLADMVHKPGDQAALISSGSYRTDGMIVAPCSMKTLAAIATGYAHELVPRAADVVLKERQRLVLLVRESPLSEIHLENMLKLARMGVVVVPPVPAFYNHPQSIDDVVNHIVTRTLDQVGLISAETARWGGHMRGQPPRDL